MKRLLIILTTLVVAISASAQNTIKQNQIQSTVTNTLSASGTQAKQFEIAQVMYNSHHWQNSSVIEIELYNVRFASGYEKYIIELGYYQGARSGNPKITHVKSEGIQHNARITLGDPVESTISNGGYINKTISILLDIRDYSQYVTKITHLRNRVSEFTGHQQIIINENPTGINVDDFTPSIAQHLNISRYQATASYPTNTSRGDAFQVFTNSNNALEFGLAGGGNTRRSWILSRHNDLSGTYGKYYNTLHLQPDTGDKSQYRGIGIGYSANTHISVGTHLSVNGNVGIGTTAPNSKLEINSIERNGLRIYREGKTDKYLSLWHGTAGAVIDAPRSDGKVSDFYIGYDQPTNIYLSREGGDVGIGTTNTKGYKLAVAGNIVSEEVKVALQANWPDYVFTKGYSLPSLKEVEKQIQENGHLSNIPSAKEIEKDGFFLGEMDSKLLEKIEELTLYTIDQEKEIELLKANSNEVSALKKQNEFLISQIHNLSKRLAKIESGK